MDQIELPSRLFADGCEPAGDRVNQYFKLNTIRAVLKALQPSELEHIRPCEESVTGEILMAKLRRPKSLTEEQRIKYACLFLVDGLLYRRSFHMKIPKQHVELIRDLDVFLSYPWGRYSFDMTMQCIKTRSPNQLAQGFIHALLLIFSEAVPALRSATGDETDPESDEEEDIPVVSFKLDKIWELDAEEG
ncbi:hypothetical protein HID58_077204, partial [Brassica napus]